VAHQSIGIEGTENRILPPLKFILVHNCFDPNWFKALWDMAKGLRLRIHFAIGEKVPIRTERTLKPIRPSES